ncbi:DUF4254 domain-containing protein [Nocardia brasiliensis]|uniref:DUF4254 domain-containing protein n=1 Tax=Nocardia brasiliensis TaxID=37326 RepID=UPI002457FF2A|nr:DUF4254 domain-containing protein [Nocardia brasiliensis]
MKNDLSAPLPTAATVRQSLPDYHQMSEAFQQAVGDKPGCHMILQLGSALAQLHRTSRIQPHRCGEADRRRTELVILIDNWVATHLPGRPGWPGPSTSLGVAADEMAAAQVDADHRLRHWESVGHHSVHEARDRLSKAANRWSDLVAEIVAAQPY